MGLWEGGREVKNTLTFELFPGTRICFINIALPEMEPTPLCING